MIELSDFYHHVCIKNILLHNFFFRIGRLGVMEKVCILFQDHPDLIEGFNAFLPSEWEIKVCGFD